MSKKIIILASLLSLMIACQSKSDLVGNKLLYDIPAAERRLPNTAVLIQPLETGCFNCVKAIRSNIDLLKKHYYIIMPKSPYNSENLNCYHPTMRDYAEWNPDYIYPTVFVVDLNMIIVEHQIFNSVQFSELIDRL